ncbi:hypothetical protein K1T71_014903 [Dendrolimus kikuchii]|nr:hypothetical protein K1T71_014903 [Dendrolimus kikuchii]
MDKSSLVVAVHASIKTIGAVCNAPNKLNIGDKTTIAGHGQDIIALVAQLALRLADAENEVSLQKQQPATHPVPAYPLPILPQPGRSYAGALKLPSGKTEPLPRDTGPAVIFYPKPDSDIKSSEETKKALQNAVTPAASGIKVTGVRMVGNAGVVVRTPTAEAAARLKSVAPPNLRIAEPKSRLPCVLLRYLRVEYDNDVLIREIHKVNLEEDKDLPLEVFAKACKAVAKRTIGQKFMVVLECSPKVRDALIRLKRLYVGWDEAEVCDYVRATCCNKCQQYGHPEKYCRAATETCGQCGENGHRSTVCKSETVYCATCKRFKRSDHTTHKTVSLHCPARLHAQQEALNRTQYG